MNGWRHDVLRAFPKRARARVDPQITAFGDVTGAMEAIGHGAYDYVSKPSTSKSCARTVARALERPTPFRRGRWRHRDGRGTGGRDRRQKPPHARCLQTGRTGRPHDGHGSSGRPNRARKGTGGACHPHPLARAGKAFVPVNCTAPVRIAPGIRAIRVMPEGPSPARWPPSAASSRWRQTTAPCFSTRLATWAQDASSALARLQDGEVRPVGGTESIRVDVRLGVRHHRDLEADVKTGRFREDLYFRINVVTVRMPPCVSAPVTSPFWCATSWPRSLAARVGPRQACRRKRWRFSVAIPGPETFASWKMPLNARWPWPRATWCCPRIFPWKSMAARRGAGRNLR